jgi:hypothetical protein
MRVRVLELIVAMAIISILVLPVSAVVIPPTKSQGKPFDDIWTAINDLQNLIQLKRGQPRYFGTCNCDTTQAEYLALVARFTASLEYVNMVIALNIF